MSKLLSLKIEKQSSNQICQPPEDLKQMVKTCFLILDNEHDENKIVQINNSINYGRDLFLKSLSLFVNFFNLNSNDYNLFNLWIKDSIIFKFNRYEIIGFIISRMSLEKQRSFFNIFIKEKNIPEEDILILLDKLLSDYKINTLYEFLNFYFSDIEINEKFRNEFSLMINKNTNFLHLLYANYLNIDKVKYINSFFNMRLIDLKPLFETHNFKFNNKKNDFSRFNRAIELGVFDNCDSDIVKLFDREEDVLLFNKLINERKNLLN